MNILEKFQTLIILSGVGMGLLLGQLPVVEQNAGAFIIPFILLMLYGLFLTIPIQNLKDAFKHIKFLSTSTLINFVWSPLLAWALGAIFLSDHPALWIGFIMLMVTPCTDWYLMFTAVARGNVSLSASLLPVNFVLQILLLPVYLFIFSGTITAVPFSAVLKSILMVIFLPFIIAHLTRLLLRNRKNLLEDRLIPFFSSAQILFLAMAITAMFASQGAYLTNSLEVLFIMMIPVLLFFIINFIVAQTAGRMMNFSYADTVSLNLTIIARNSPVALAIAVTAFPNQPLIALVLVIGPLIELPVLAIVSQILLLFRKRRR